jgi:hypothetical protein
MDQRNIDPSEGNGLLGRLIVGTVGRGGRIEEFGETKILSSVANTWRGLGMKLNVKSIARMRVKIIKNDDGMSMSARTRTVFTLK